MVTETHKQFVKDFKLITGKELRILKDTDWFIPRDWFHEVFTILDFTIITKILKKWKEDNLSKELLDDFKLSINRVKKDNYFLRLLIHNNDNGELIYLLIHFGLEVDDNIFKAIIEIESKIEKLQKNMIFFKKT